MSAKPDDKYTVPLHQVCPDGGGHGEQHNKFGEPEFWARLGIDPLDLALRLWAVTGDIEAGVRAVFRARQAIEMRNREKTP